MESGNPSSYDKLYTLIIPTYNRPTQLLRLLHYICSFKNSFRILILDSSSADVQEFNSSTISNQAGEVEHIRFDPSIDALSKFENGISLVKTPYCSFCADDDIVFVDTVMDCIKYLEANQDYAAAHGYYFNFTFGERIIIDSVVYWRNALTVDAPLMRLVALMKNYEAVFYATYRTEVLRRIFSLVRRVDTNLYKELILGAATVLNGKVYRHPEFYYGRSTDASHPYESWHPHEILAKSPEILLNDYGRYREALLEHLQSIDGATPLQQSRVFDLAHLRYFQEYLAPEILDFIIDRSLAGENGDSITRAIWARWVQTPPQSIRVRRYFVGNHSSLINQILLFPRSLMSRILHGLRGRERLDGLVTSQLPDGQGRIYRFTRQFFDLGSAGIPCDDNIRMIVANLNHYV
jgi:glycosyltransferase domain-containing protein